MLRIILINEGRPMLTRLTLLCCCFILVLGSRAAEAQEKPNILWIYVEDMNDWFGCYGHDLVKTPNVDALAKDGVRFERAYVPAPVCSATRSAIITGCMQTTTGTHQHRTFVKKPLAEKYVTIPELFRENGYLTFNNRKTDYNFIFDHDVLYTPKLKKLVNTKNYEWMAQLTGQPFFGQLQFVGGKVGGEAGARYPANSSIPEDTVHVPPQYPDTPVFRNGIARHLEQIQMIDKQVGKLVKALKENNLFDNTIIFFFTDHGYQLPRAKQFVYEEGIRVPLIIANLGNRDVMVPSVRNDLVSGIDLGPTSLQLAGIETPDHMEGQPLLAKDYQPKEFVIAARDRLDFTVDRMRAVVTKRFKYIKNYFPERPLLTSNYRDGYATFQELKRLKKDGKLSELHQRIYFADKPTEELYDLVSDPDELNNLATDPKFLRPLQRHRKLLEDWMAKTGDQGGKPESDEELRAQIERWKEKATAPEFDRVRK